MVVNERLRVIYTFEYGKEINHVSLVYFTPFIISRMKLCKKALQAAAYNRITTVCEM